jgi:diaminohydroxyphosphoribosylaminopyrimidine deaminase/5-amino-6-(5-phosphoribosylamino)uracil reductase
MSDADFMRLALRLARRGYGATSPNPMVGAVLVKGGKIIGRGWHRRAGLPHAEIEAVRDAERRGHATRGATLHVTLEPCSSHGRTPPCTEAILAAGIRRVVVGAVDPNPIHAGRGLEILRRAGVRVSWWGDHPQRQAETNRGHGSSAAMPGASLVDACESLNEAFNHWIVHRTPFVTVKAAMTLDGKIATATGESKWITGPRARAFGMRLRQGVDAVLVGVNTVLADDPALTDRSRKAEDRRLRPGGGLRRIVLDSMARTPLTSKVVADKRRRLTTIVVSRHAPKRRVAALAKRVRVLVAPSVRQRRSGSRSSNGSARLDIDLSWLLRVLGGENVTSLLVEGGGEVNASFLLRGLAQRVAFFYAPRILGGHQARKGVAGEGAMRLAEAVRLDEIRWKKLGPDLALTARLGSPVRFHS